MARRAWTRKGASLKAGGHGLTMRLSVSAGEAVSDGPSGARGPWSAARVGNCPMAVLERRAAACRARSLLPLGEDG